MASSPVAFSSVLGLVLVLGLFGMMTGSEPVEDKSVLLDFLGRIPHRKLNWESSTSACTHWIGVYCDSARSRIVEVHLPGVALSGQIPPNTLSRLSGLRILSLRSNALTGPFPSDFFNLTSLVGLHLQHNRFSGELPRDFSAWGNLLVLNLGFNHFQGTISSSISNLTSLSALNLGSNNLTGVIPADIHLPNLVSLNLSGNNLVGDIPESLRKFPNSAFSGNRLIPFSTNASSSSSPLSSRSPPGSKSPPTRSKKKKRILTQSEILGIAVGGCGLVFMIIATIIILYFTKRRREQNVVSGKHSKGDRSPERAVTSNQDENNRLVFFEGCSFAFDLEDLLRASAEVLGKGTFGTAYKAALEDSTTVVVKRLKDVGVGKKEFEQHMELVGKIKHDNVVELRAYYYSKDEKLIVYDHHSLGSVSTMLHGMQCRYVYMHASFTTV